MTCWEILSPHIRVICLFSRHTVHDLPCNMRGFCSRHPVNSKHPERVGPNLQRAKHASIHVLPGHGIIAKTTYLSGYRLRKTKESTRCGHGNTKLATPVLIQPYNGKGIGQNLETTTLLSNISASATASEASTSIPSITLANQNAHKHQSPYRPTYTIRNDCICLNQVIIW